jgi:hypothetical protein
VIHRDAQKLIHPGQVVLAGLSPFKTSAPNSCCAALVTLVPSVFSPLFNSASIALLTAASVHPILCHVMVYNIPP